MLTGWADVGWLLVRRQAITAATSGPSHGAGINYKVIGNADLALGIHLYIIAQREVGGG